MEATNNEVQTDETVSPDVLEQNKENQPTQFDDMSPDEIKNFALRMSSQLHKVNEESKGRKIKNRELSAQLEDIEKSKLEEQGEFKKLYETANNELNELRPLRAYKDEQDRLQESKLVELEKQLTALEREELEILDVPLIDKKIRWIEFKLNNRTSVNLDTSSSVQGGGSLKQMPQNRREMSSLNSEELMKFRSKFPDQYRVAMNTK